MNRIERKFKELKRKRQKAFVVFLTCGYPDLRTTKILIKELYRAGVDIIELGIPFSDPLADGKLIQESSAYALKKGIDIFKVFKLASETRRITSIPLCLLTYYNPIICFGLERFMRMSRDSGVDGLIIPDLPPEESKDILKIAKSYGISVIFFISPTTSGERLKLICNLSRGFIYYVSLTGVTGPREKLPVDLIDNLKKIKKITSKPVCVGFGISRPDQIKRLYKIVDGVIVGSAIIKKIKDNLGKPDLIKKVVDFVLWLRGNKISYV
ncbi:MAG: tryptophan synthase subunit alpha [Candidatus Omnitrophica bacterium]|nr:tryptophan synthase subunit alpha [Candidatus Omnitrophota bacterium]